MYKTFSNNATWREFSEGIGCLRELATIVLTVLSWFAGLAVFMQAANVVPIEIALTIFLTYSSWLAFSDTFSGFVGRLSTWMFTTPTYAKSIVCSIPSDTLPEWEIAFRSTPHPVPEKPPRLPS